MGAGTTFTTSIFIWLGRARNKRENFAANRGEAKETKQKAKKVIKKTDSVGLSLNQVSSISVLQT